MLYYYSQCKYIGSREGECESFEMIQYRLFFVIDSVRGCLVKIQVQELKTSDWISDPNKMAEHSGRSSRDFSQTNDTRDSFGRGNSRVYLNEFCFIEVYLV